MRCDTLFKVFSTRYRALCHMRNKVSFVEAKILISFSLFRDYQILQFRELRVMIFRPYNKKKKECETRNN